MSQMPMLVSPPPPPPSASVQRVAVALQQLQHPHAPQWLAQEARTAEAAAQMLGVQTGQIAKSVIFQRLADQTAVLVVTAGDRRVDVNRVNALLGTVGPARAAFVKAQTGFAIGGVSPVAHARPLLCLLDASLQRFDTLWAAAGHPRAVFCLQPDDLERITGAPWAEVAASEVPA